MVLSMDRWVGKVAVVTGASSGIGAAIAETLAKEGLKLLPEERTAWKIWPRELLIRKEKLSLSKQTYKRNRYPKNAFTWIKNNLGPTHILVNNAGVVPASSEILRGKTDSWQKLFQVNVLGLCICTREAVKDMKENKVDGHIVHIINSRLGHKVKNLPVNTVYPSSKFAVTALAETLRLELMNQKSKIKMSSVSPALTDTEFLKNPKNRRVIDMQKILQPQDIADAVVYVLSTPPHVQVQELSVGPYVVGP
ncbi:hypothetical protein NQ315_003157 [Exocentrus adspersus]|uniref:Dehydrogenase/reductase SDR family member 11 n=1 Tax=Exocentrus adspersus TaxID=1586481 RepID=A0AAV8W5E0_9CUCU|nr:hypothetical protein NQ315_003157 [Exocentrus adspersus]